MKSFLKYVLATIVGVVIVNLVVCVFFVLFIGALAVFSEKTVTVPEGSVLTIRLDHPLQDRVSDNPMDNFDFFSLELNAGMGLNRILESIHCAATDNRIKGIYLNLGDIQGTFGGLATTKEIRDALEEFKESGKFIYSYSNLGYSQLSYYLAERCQPGAGEALPRFHVGAYRRNDFRKPGDSGRQHQCACRPRGFLYNGTDEGGWVLRQRGV